LEKPDGKAFEMKIADSQTNILLNFQQNLPYNKNLFPENFFPFRKTKIERKTISEKESLFLVSFENTHVYDSLDWVLEMDITVKVHKEERKSTKIKSSLYCIGKIATFVDSIKLKNL